MAQFDHPKNMQDLSAENGFQWKFDCDICNTGFTTTFIPSKSESRAKKLGFLGRGLEIAGGFAGKGGLSSAGQAADAAGQYQSMSAAWRTEHDGAFGHAVNEATTHFKKCPKCKLYVCDDDWNDEAGLCKNDAPSPVSETVCTTCGQPGGPGKFCQNCGAALGFKVCANCNHQNPVNVSFCGECGTKL